MAGFGTFGAYTPSKVTVAQAEMKNIAAVEGEAFFNVQKVMIRRLFSPKRNQEEQEEKDIQGKLCTAPPQKTSRKSVSGSETQPCEACVAYLAQNFLALHPSSLGLLLTFTSPESWVPARWQGHVGGEGVERGGWGGRVWDRIIRRGVSAALVTLHDVTPQVSLVATAKVVVQTTVQSLGVIPHTSTNQPRFDRPGTPQ
ncbi:hypothetical protein O3P69_006345 [Scylla paramamosain]|uniref:Uncharacterized protein n=1 Tax=Scylla paramamosain TaxID=85552 RepID=A0AAW0U3J3_SCYPA